MTSITSSIRSAFRSRDQHRDEVHIHLAHDGRPYVCDVARCDSPSLTVGEADRLARGL